MEIDLSACKFRKISGLIPIGIILVLLCLGLFGWVLAPQGRILTWTEWQVVQQQMDYQRGLRVLAQNANRLALLLEAPPDPVRTQLMVEQVTEDLEAINLLPRQEPVSALGTAADGIVQWALGNSDLQTAVSLLNKANQVIEKAMLPTLPGIDGELP